MNIPNSGLANISRVVSLGTVSAFTLIHLAKDNGVKLHFVKVEIRELVKLPRPAILHANNNRFVFIEDGKPMPLTEYSGYALTIRPAGVLLSYDEAKKVIGV